MLRDIENGSECGSVLALVSELEMVQTAIATEVFATERAAVLEHGDRVGERDGLLVISLGDDTVRITCAELERAIEIGRLGEEIGFTYPLVLSDGELITVSFADLFAEQGEQGLAFVRAITGGRLTGSLPATLQEWRARRRRGAGGYHDTGRRPAPSLHEHMGRYRAQRRRACGSARRNGRRTDRARAWQVVTLPWLNATGFWQH
jgi:hypothetical protein